MIIQNAPLKKLLEEKDVLIKEARELTSQIEKLEKERAKLGMKVQKVKDKVIPMVDKMKGKEIVLGEYDDIETISLEKGEIVVNIFNHLEEFKKQFAERFKKAEN